jgi:hypothetical protein
MLGLQAVGKTTEDEAPKTVAEVELTGLFQGVVPICPPKVSGIPVGLAPVPALPAGPVAPVGPAGPAAPELP